MFFTAAGPPGRDVGLLIANSDVNVSALNPVGMASVHWLEPSGIAGVAYIDY